MKAINIAKYYLSKDSKLFNDNRLNAYLFLTQVVYLAKYGKVLFCDEFIASVDGPVISKLVENNEIVEIPKEVRKFLDKIYYALINAGDEELLNIIKEDPTWLRLKPDTKGLVLKLEDNIGEYKIMYKGLIQALK